MYYEKNIYSWKDNWKWEMKRVFFLFSLFIASGSLKHSSRTWTLAAEVQLRHLLTCHGVRWPPGGRWRSAWCRLCINSSSASPPSFSAAERLSPPSGCLWICRSTLSGSFTREWASLVKLNKVTWVSVWRSLEWVATQRFTPCIPKEEVYLVSYDP